MTKTEILEALKQLTSEECLEIIEFALHRVREEIQNKVPTTAEKQLSLAAAAEIMRSYYEKGSELTVFTDLDTEDFYEYEDYA